MAISKVQYKSSPSATPVVWMDATQATASAGDIVSPKTAMLSNGIVTQGTGTGGNDEVWELIKEVTVSENSTEILANTDSNGDSFKLRKMVAIFSAGQPTTGTKDSFYVLVGIKNTNGTTGTTSAPSLTYASATSPMCSRQNIEAEPNMPLFELSVVGTSEGNTKNAEMMPKANTIADYITSYRIYQASSDKSYIPSGATLKIYGVRYNE